MASNRQKVILETDGPFLLTATFWKRFVVVMTIALSAAGLILSAIASLNPESESDRRRLLIWSIVVNAISISLSALTSLDWKKDATYDRVFAARLLRIAQAHIDSDGQVVISAKDLKNLSSI